MNQSSEKAIFGGGCFWCTEAVFESLRGVTSVMPGYAGGDSKNPTYESVCSGETGHAEVIQVEFDPSIISYEDLLAVFFASHNPTTKNRQGNDVGTQYRSIVLTTSDAQMAQIKAFIQKLDEGAPMGEKVVTEVEPLEVFYPAEAYHHHYFQSHPDQAYCQFVVNPKLEKIRAHFSKLMNSGSNGSTP